MWIRRFVLVASVGFGAALGGGGVLGACSAEQKPPTPPVEVTAPPYGMPFDTLAEWHLFSDPLHQTPADRVIPYEVISPLFSDYATKFRFLYMPKGVTINYTDTGAWDFPVGTVLVKTFAYRADSRDPSSALRLLETRLLWREPDGWSVHTYVWDDAQKTATRNVAGPIIPSDFIDPSGQMVHNDYAVPNTAQCKECHSTGNTPSMSGQANGVVTPLGLKTRQLNREHDYGGTIGKANQIDHFASLGFFSAPPPGASARPSLVDPMGTSDVSTRVRSYWDGNCSHCHSKGGFASSSALLLDFPSTDPASNPPANWGICKMPTSDPFPCGNVNDVVPGNPDASIMVCRVGTTNAKYKMPLLGGNLVDAQGVELIKAWISSLTPATCM
jgi:uncharacterized repeat protein (TIGR03806 family)